MKVVADAFWEVRRMVSIAWRAKILIAGLRAATPQSARGATPWTEHVVNTVEDNAPRCQMVYRLHLPLGHGRALAGGRAESTHR